MRAGRSLTGAGQLGIALAGFFLICGWMLQFFYRIFQAQLGDTVSHQPVASWLWELGAVCFCISWTWTFLTCVSLYRDAKAYEQAMRNNPPPPLSEVPPKNPGNP